MRYLEDRYHIRIMAAVNAGQAADLLVLVGDQGELVTLLGELYGMGIPLYAVEYVGKELPVA